MVQIEESITTARQRVELAQKKRERIEKTEDDDQKMVLLSEESKILRGELKNLNNSLNLFLEEMQIMKIKASAKNKKAMDPGEYEEHKRVLKEREIENYDKMTTNLVKEYNKLSKRLDWVSNPQYVFDLREKVDEMKNYVKSLKDDKKKMEKNQANRDKKLNYMMNQGGEIGHLKNINNTHNELTVTRNQLIKLEKRFEKMNVTKQANQDQIQSLTDKLNKLQELAEKHNIDVDKVAQEVQIKQSNDDFLKSKKELEDKRNIRKWSSFHIFSLIHIFYFNVFDDPCLHSPHIVDKAIKVQKAKYQLLFKQEKAKYEEIIADKQELIVLLKQKEEEAKQKNEMVAELKTKYEKYKAEAEVNNYVKDEGAKPKGKLEST